MFQQFFQLLNNLKDKIDQSVQENIGELISEGSISKDLSNRGQSSEKVLNDPVVLDLESLSNEPASVEDYLLQESTSRNGDNSKSYERKTRTKRQARLKKKRRRVNRPASRINFFQRSRKSRSLANADFKLEIAVITDGKLYEDFAKTFKENPMEHLVSYVFRLINFANLRYRHKTLGMKIDICMVGLWVYSNTHRWNPTRGIANRRGSTYLRSLRRFANYNIQMKRTYSDYRPDTAILLTGLSDNLRAGVARIGGACSWNGITVTQARYACPQQRTAGTRARARPDQCVRNMGAKVLPDATKRRFEFTVFLNSATIAHELGHTMGMEDLYGAKGGRFRCRSVGQARLGIMGKGLVHWEECSVRQLLRWLGQPKNAQCLKGSRRRSRKKKKSPSKLGRRKRFKRIGPLQHADKSSSRSLSSEELESKS